MPAATKKESEPVGIIILQARPKPAAPRFSSYVWGTVEEPETDPENVKVA